MHSSLSLLSLLQYALLALVAYVLAGAPLLTLLSGGGTSGRRDAVNSGNASLVLEMLAIPQPGLRCEEHKFTGVHVLRTEPLVVYIEGFLSEEEAREIVNVSTPNFQPSTVWTNGVETLNPAVRHSSKAALPRSHTTQCIESRARAFQGWAPYLFTEKLWAQRYGPGGHYTYHYDWSSVSPGSGRATSFMVYVAANCTGGGTHFPRLERPAGEEWCRFVECEGDEGRMDGTVFKASARNAVFWENMRGGRGFEESWHAGLPVREGEKIGLNIWSWLQEGFVPEVGGQDGEGQDGEEL